MKAWDFVNDILVGKVNLIVDSDSENLYEPFVVNRALSYYRDSVMQANMMNTRRHLDKKMQNDFLLNNVRSYKRRYIKWAKVDKNDSIEYIQVYFNCSKNKARDYVLLLDDNQINQIKEKTNTGGIVGK